MSVCLAGAGVAVAVSVGSFTLSWTHTVEKTEWIEEWQASEGELVLERARVKGSGAGMEPPAEATLEQGFYVWRPELSVLDILLRRDAHAGDWRLCAAGRCDEIAGWLGRDVDPVRIYAAGAKGCVADGRASSGG
jgi:hypothetical protein